VHAALQESLRLSKVQIYSELHIYLRKRKREKNARTSCAIRFAVQKADKGWERTEERVYPKEFVQFGFRVAHTDQLSPRNIPCESIA